MTVTCSRSDAATLSGLRAKAVTRHPAASALSITRTPERPVALYTNIVRAPDAMAADGEGRLAEPEADTPAHAAWWRVKSATGRPVSTAAMAARERRAGRAPRLPHEAHFPHETGPPTLPKVTAACAARPETWAAAGLYCKERACKVSRQGVDGRRRGGARKEGP